MAYIFDITVSASLADSDLIIAYSISRRICILSATVLKMFPCLIQRQWIQL